MKGQLSAVVAILLVILVIGLAFSVYYFGVELDEIVKEETKGETDEIMKETDAGLMIDSVDKSENTVEIRNIGETNLTRSGFNFYLNGTLIEATPFCGPELTSEGTCTFELPGGISEAGTLMVRGEYETWDEVNLTEV